MRFEWDAEKAKSNFRKHGVSFDTAVRVFADPFALLEHDRIEGANIVGRQPAWLTPHWYCWLHTQIERKTGSR
ncbi:BrnT family toxin [Mesorhizobium sp. CO1-1-8]|uniref:BrnT family toxin n=1 Tax=Mesorhizobium sp. CO1-1-8 TaxID=2876631 RepID=UPI00398F23E2